MRIIVSGGGTAGHINPAIAIGNYIKKQEKNAKILYVGANNGMEEKLAKKAGFDFAPIKISGFQRKVNVKSIIRNFITLKRIITSSIESKRILKDFKPDICIGTGGYVSGPILRSASKMGIKIVIHEQNAFPGITTRILSKYANCVMLATNAARKHLEKNIKVEITGNPIRNEIFSFDKQEARKKLKLDSRPVILSFGGSLGASKINKILADLMEYTTKNQNKFQHIHAYGNNDLEFLNILKSKNIVFPKENLKISKYINNMPECLIASDLVICRAGAITISELQACGKPSILIPSPNVSENHQFHNAMELVKNNAAKIIEEKKLNKKILINTVEEMLSNKNSFDEISRNAKNMAIIDADKKIHKIVRNLLNLTND